MAIDFGQVRVGLAKCDKDMLLASPVATLQNGEHLFVDLITIIRQVEPSVIYVGNPINLQGQPTASTHLAVEFAYQLMNMCEAEQIQLQIRLVDERLTTVSAQSAVHKAGRTSKQARDFIDQAAAMELLEFALNIERAQKAYAGELVQVKN